MNYGRFHRIISIKSDKNALRRLLQNRGGELEVSAKRLLDVIGTSGCKSVVLEDEYIDSDFRDSHKQFYYLHYKDTPRRCKRLHFFATEVTVDDLALMPESISTTYLGYSVIRPLPSHPLGCTILSENVLGRMFPRLNVTEDRYLACSAIQQVNLAGNKISFRGVPWMQQDKMVAACASIAIWVANRHLSERFPYDFKRSTSARITKLATQFNPATGRGMPSDGLTAEQMVRALTSLGYEPLYLEAQSSDDATRICSQYIRSSVPVIAILTFPEGGHAVTLVGHTVAGNPIQDKEPTQIGTSEMRLFDMSDLIPRFIAQDDSGGPLRFLDFLSWDEAIRQKCVSPETRRALESRFDVVARLMPRVNGREDIAYLTSLLIPLPLRVTLKAKQAHRNAKEIVKGLLIEDGQLREDALILDTFLRPSNDYKSWWSPLTGRPTDVAPILRRHTLPLWIWITEISTLAKSGKAGVVVGHVIQDSSGRGTRHVLDDLIGLVGPKSMALAMPDGTFTTSVRTYPKPICKFRDGEAI